MDASQRKPVAREKRAPEAPPTSPSAQGQTQAEGARAPAAEAAAVRHAPGASSAARRAAKFGPRIWALPAAGGKIWPLWENPNAESMAGAIESGAPTIIADGSVNAEQALDQAAQQTRRAFRARSQAAAFSFLQRMVVCGALFIAGLAIWRAPGEAKLLDVALIGGSIGYFAYVLARYGFGALRWHHRRVDAVQAFSRGQVAGSALCQRFTRALELRTKLDESERGKSPDAELLDTNAYRKLIREGVATPEELARVGQAVDEALGLRDPSRRERRAAEMAQEAGIDVNTALFYIDMANAAREIAIESDVRQALDGET